MAKSLDTVGSITMASSDTLAADTTWMQSTGLIDISGKNGMNLVFQITFGSGATGEVTLYLVQTNDTGTADPDKDITSASEAYPLATVTAVASTIVTVTPDVPMEKILQGNLIGVGAKNTDDTNSVDISCAYQTLTL